MSRFETTVSAPSAPQVLVVDDHRKIREPLAVLLRRAGMEVRVADSAAAMALVLRHAPVDLVVLDAMLPDGDGFELCRRLCADGGPPVILLTARGEVQDRVTGLGLGADDYVVKPFEPDELVARIRNVLRRSPLRPPPVAQAAPAREVHRYAFGPWTLDTRYARLSATDGRTVELSATEQRLLLELIRNAGVVVTREQLQALGGRGRPAGFGRTIDRQVSRLRSKLEADPRQPRWLRTAWGDGYILTVDAVALKA